MSDTKIPGRPFPPGVSGNPGGRPKLPDDIKEARAMNQVEVARTLDRFLNLTREQLRARLADSSASALDHLIGSIIVKGIHHGDQRRLDFLLDRIIGKVPTQVDARLEGSGAGDSFTAEFMSRDQFEQLILSARGPGNALSMDGLERAYAQYCQTMLTRFGIGNE